MTFILEFWIVLMSGADSWLMWTSSSARIKNTPTKKKIKKIPNIRNEQPIEK